MTFWSQTSACYLESDWRPTAAVIFIMNRRIRSKSYGEAKIRDVPGNTGRLASLDQQRTAVVESCFAWRILPILFTAHDWCRPRRLPDKQSAVDPSPTYVLTAESSRWRSGSVHCRTVQPVVVWWSLLCSLQEVFH